MVKIFWAFGSNAHERSLAQICMLLLSQIYTKDNANMTEFIYLSLNRNSVFNNCLVLRQHYKGNISQCTLKLANMLCTPLLPVTITIKFLRKHFNGRTRVRYRYWARDLQATRHMYQIWLCIKHIPMNLVEWQWHLHQKAGSCFIVGFPFKCSTKPSYWQYNYWLQNDKTIPVYE